MNAKGLRLFLGTALVSMLVILAVLLCRPYYLTAPITELKQWHVHTFPFIYLVFGCVRFLGPWFLVLLLLIFILFLITYSRLRRFLKSREALLLAVSCLLTFIAAEIFIRKVLHIQPGQLTYNRWFTPVDSLVIYHGFYTDEAGIMKIEPQAASYIADGLQTPGPDTSDFGAHGQFEKIYSLVNDFKQLQADTFHSTFKQYLQQLKQPVNTQLDEVDQAVLKYALCPINTQGFRSIAFRNYKTPKKKVLLLGDSFTWGFSAGNKTNSFADLLLAKGYAVYNTGIATADVAQYLAIAQKYIDTIMPDVVVVNFFMGNDVSYYKRVVQPGMPIVYTTNAGNLLACPHGIYFNNAAQAYKFNMALTHMPGGTCFNRICALTATGTLIWKTIVKTGLIPAQNEDYRWYWARARADSIPVCNNELNAIRNLCSKSHARFLLVVINDVLNGSVCPQHVPHLFEGLPYLQSPVQKEGYDLRDGHFNDAGHRQYANFLDSLILRP